MDFEKQLAIKYPYLSKEDVKAIIDKAKMFYYALKYPCVPNASETDRPIRGFVAEQWVMSACDELIERLGFSSAIGYRENGVTWSFDGAVLSDRLCNLIKPTIGVI